MTTKRAVKKPTKRKPTKRKPTKAAATPKQSAGPKDVEIKGELRYKLEAMQLKIDNRRMEISAPLLKEQQQKFENGLARALRNDPQFVKLSGESPPGGSVAEFSAASAEVTR